jgi:hypothetical protein
MGSIKSEKSPGQSKKAKQSWSKSLETGKLTEKITVSEVENGFLVTHCKYGEGKDGGYMSEEKKYITKENPLEEEEEKQSFADSLKYIMSEIAESEGMLEVE